MEVLSSCDVQASHDSGFSCCGAQASVVMAHGLRCPVACGILVPGPEVKPVSSASAGGFLTTDHQGTILTLKWENL